MGSAVPILQFQTVTKYFSPESIALQEVSFEIEPGELIFVTGPSGSGKTTLMRLMTCEHAPSEGEIFFNDTPLSSIRPSNVHHHRRKIGVVFQDYRLIPDMNVWENIALPLYVSGAKDTDIEQRVTDLLNLIKLPEKAESFPSQLSGGEAQRVSIARALASAPEVIFADEPTGNLDPETSKGIASLLRKINELGTTVFIATHDWEILGKHSDIRQIHLDQGKVIKDSKVGKQPTPPKNEAPEPTKPEENDDDSPEPKSEHETILDTAPQDTPVRSTNQPWWKRWMGGEKSPQLDPEADAEQTEDDSDTTEIEDQLDESEEKSTADKKESVAEKSASTAKSPSSPKSKTTEKTNEKSDSKQTSDSKSKSDTKKKSDSASSTKKKTS